MQGPARGAAERRQQPACAVFAQLQGSGQGRQHALAVDAAAGHQMHPQLRRGRGCAVGKPTIEILPGCLRQAVPHRRVLHQHHGLAAQRLLQGKAGVVEGLYRQLHPGHLQRGGHAGRAAAAKAVQQGPQYGIHPRTAGQQPPR